MLLFNIAGLLVAIPRFFIWDTSRRGTVLMNADSLEQDSVWIRMQGLGAAGAQQQPGLGGVGLVLGFGVVEVELDAVQRLLAEDGHSGEDRIADLERLARAMAAFFISSGMCRSMRPY